MQPGLVDRMVPTHSQKKFWAFILFFAMFSTRYYCTQAWSSQCYDMRNYYHGVLFNAVNGLRFGCWGEETSESGVDWPFYPSSICYPAGTNPDRPTKCQPYYSSKDGLFNLFSLVENECPGHPTKTDRFSCRNDFEDYLKITFHPTARNLVNEVSNYVTFVDDPINPGYLFNRADNPNEVDNLAFLLGIDSTYPYNRDVGYALVRYYKFAEVAQDIDMNTIKLNTPKVNDLFNDMQTATTDNDVLMAMSTYGTHYLLGVDISDYVLQVFVFERDDYNFVVSEYPDTPEYRNGTKSSEFLRYAKPKGHSGYSHAVGAVKTFGYDPSIAGCLTRIADYDNGLTTSIFKFYEDPEACNINNMRNYAARIRIGSVSELFFSDPQHKDLKDYWDRVLSESLTQRFTDGVNFPLPDNTAVTKTYDFYADFNPILTTHTATAFNTIAEMYFDLNDVDIINPEYSQNFFIIADVIEIFQDVDIPATVSLHIICRLLVSHSSTGNVPVIRTGTNNVHVVAVTIEGMFQILVGTERKTFTNDNVITSLRDVIINVDKPFTTTTGLISRIPYAKADVLPHLYATDSSDDLSIWQTGAFTQGLQLAIITVENILALGVATDENSISTATECLDWIIETLSGQPNGTLTQEMEEVQGRALTLKKTKILYYQGTHVMVSRLTYKVYQFYYQTLIKKAQLYEEDLQALYALILQQKQTEAIISSQQELNDNVLRIGSYLVAATEANREYQESMSEYYENIVRMDLDQIDEKQAEAELMLTEIEELQELAGYLGEAYYDCLTDSARRAIIKSMFMMTKTLFTPVSNPTKAWDTLKGITTVAEKLQYAMSALKASFELYNELRQQYKKISSINRNLEGLNELQTVESDFPTLAEWNDFDIEVEQYTDPSTVPNLCTGQAGDYQANSNKISSRGKIYLDLAREIEKLHYEVISLSLQKGISDAHAANLEELSHTMQQTTLTDYEANTTDLLAIGAIIQTNLNEVRLELGQVYRNLDSGLQHYYLMPASPFTGYDIQSIMTTSLNQMQLAEHALLDYDNPPADLPQPTVFNIPHVLVEDLLNATGAIFTIDINDDSFWNFVRVRVNYLEVFIDDSRQPGIVTNPGNTIDFSVIARGNFLDRGPDRDLFHFVSEPLSYPFVYELDSKEILVNNEPVADFKEKYMQMTPFTDWVFSIPKYSIYNRDLKFASSHVDLTFKLYVSASTKRSTGPPPTKS